MLKAFTRVLVFCLFICLLFVGCDSGNTPDDGLVNMYIPCALSQTDADGNVIAQSILVCDTSGLEEGKLVFTLQSPQQGFTDIVVENGTYTQNYQEADIVSICNVFDASGRCVKNIVTYSETYELMWAREQQMAFDDQGIVEKITTIITLNDGTSTNQQISAEKRIDEAGIWVVWDNSTIKTEYLYNEAGKALQYRVLSGSNEIQKNVNTYDEHWNLVATDIYVNSTGTGEATYYSTTKTDFQAIQVPLKVASMYPMFSHD